MSVERTEQQSSEQIRSAQDLSLKPKTPPAQVVGYQIDQHLGSGAYGEVWRAVDQRTGRRVAIKFYTRQGAVDLSLLSREVEKLVFLSADRYVVQLLDVGWDSRPPYYVMDFIEQGSLEDELQRRGTFPVNEALELIVEIGIGLMHLHGKGILHCDLKPGNVLLDQDNKPRLADFGQSRLSHELAPALGTLFFMAPEQADVRSTPDARWDVYALGALMYCLLTGEPPFRDKETIRKIESSEGLEDRLAQYRSLIASAPRPTAHRRVPGVDRSLADIIDRCIARNPRQRYSTVQSVIEALQFREQAHARRPLVILGIVGPLLLLAVISAIGWNAYRGAILQTEQSITRKTLESSHWIAQVAARSASEQIDHYFRVVNEMAGDPEILAQLQAVVADPEIREALDQLADPGQNANKLLEPVRNRLIANPLRKTLQTPLQDALTNSDYPVASSWFICDASGTQVASVFAAESPSSTIGRNFSFRTYFSGTNRSLVVQTPEGDDYLVSDDPAARERIDRPLMSDVFQSKATNTWKVAFSAPLYKDGTFIGIIAVTAELGSLIEFENARNQYVMLVDSRPGDFEGLVLEHPLLREILSANGSGKAALPAGLSARRVSAETLEALNSSRFDLEHFHDPIADDPAGKEWDRDWIASWADVISRSLRDGPYGFRAGNGFTGLKVIAVSDRDQAMAPSRDLGRRLANMGILALLVFLLVSGSLLYLVFRSFRHKGKNAIRIPGSASELVGSASPEMDTMLPAGDPAPGQ
jgi:eukaryotic-like serine/threonine-protein kinase